MKDNHKLIIDSIYVKHYTDVNLSWGLVLVTELVVAWEQERVQQNSTVIRLTLPRLCCGYQFSLVE